MGKLSCGSGLSFSKDYELCFKIYVCVCTVCIFSCSPYNHVCERGHVYATDVCRCQKATLDVSPQLSSYDAEFLYDSSLVMRGYLTGVHA